MKLSLVGLVLFLYPLFLSTKPIFAQTSLSVTPAIIERAVQKGETSTVEIKIRNSSTSPLPISFYAESFNEFKTLNFEKRQRYDASRWLSFNEEVALFSAQESRNIPINISVPDDALSGGHYARIVVRALTLEQQDTSRQTVLPELNISFFITVAGEVDDSLEVATKNIFPWYLKNDQKLFTDVRIRNSGNVHNLASPVVIVKKNNEEIARYSPQPEIILPEQERKFSIVIEPISQNGKHQLYVYVQANKENISDVSKIETIIVGPSITSIIFIALFSWTLLFCFTHRKRLVKATMILLGRE